MQVRPNHWIEAKAADPKGKLYGARTGLQSPRPFCG